MNQPLRVLMIGAHPDDCDFECGGLALLYAQAGHQVKFLSLCNGCGGHHEMTPADVARRRYGETQAVAKLAGLEYEVWDIPDCELIADLETRKRLIRTIRAYDPHLVFIHRPNDYHTDHRNASLLVQDASYLLTVPNFVPEAPAMRRMPVILHSYDRFRNPPFVPDVVVDIDSVIEKKFDMMHCHVSQVYEWLPYTREQLEQIPADPADRLEWLHGKRIDRSQPPLPLEVLQAANDGNHHEYREAIVAGLYRDKLIERYGERGRRIHFAEAFSVSEYGKPLTKALEAELFPF